MLHNYTMKAKQHSKMDKTKPKVFLRTCCHVRIISVMLIMTLMMTLKKFTSLALETGGRWFFELMVYGGDQPGRRFWSSLVKAQLQFNTVKYFSLQSSLTLEVKNPVYVLLIYISFEFIDEEAVEQNT